MGRKKIKIRPIKDDRNRAVTFLKRKNGLFKKAFELAVLCRAEVAVIVFAGNKKLYEFASSDIKDVLYRYTQAPEPYEHRGPEDFQNKEDGDSDDSEDLGMDVSPDYHHRVMSHTPQGHGTPPFNHPMNQHNRRLSEDSIGSNRRQSLHHGTPQILPHRTPPLHSRQTSLQHIDTPPQQFQVPMIPGHNSSPQPTTSAVRGPIMQQPVQEGLGLGIGMTTPQPYGMQYNPYGHQYVHLAPHDNPPPRRPSSNPSYQYQNQQQENPYQPSPPLRSMSHPHIQTQSNPDPPPQQSMPLPQLPEIPSKGRMKSIHTPVSSRASSLAAHFENRSHVERPQPSLPPPPRSHSVDSSATPNNKPTPLVSTVISASPPPITTTTPGSTTGNSGQRPKLSLHIPDDEDHAAQPEDSPGSATPGTASPEQPRHNPHDRPDPSKSEPTDHDHDTDRPRDRDRDQSEFFLPPPSASGLLPNGGKLPAPGLGAYDANNSGGTPLSALPSRYAGDMLPSPSTFYPEFYGTLPSAGTSNVRGGFGGIMNGTPIVQRAEEAHPFGGFGSGNGNGNGNGNGGAGEKRRSDDVGAGTSKRPKN